METEKIAPAAYLIEQKGHIPLAIGNKYLSLHH